ncbi:MAG: hypothetical protein WD795_16050 [Woeseia sp.]
MRSSRLFAVLPTLLTLGVLSGVPSLAHADAPHRYRVAVDAGMSRMWVEARFSAPVDSVTAQSNEAGQFLLDVRDCDDASSDASDNSTIRLRNRRMMLPAGGIHCMNYSVDLASAAASVPHNQSLAPENVVVSPALWLWRPRLTRDSEIRIEFDLPGEMQVAVPWQRLERDRQSFLLGDSPESSSAPAVFGTFEYSEIDVPGATLRVSVLRGSERTQGGMDDASIKEWLRTTATGISLAYGRFPNPSPQIVVIPVADGRRGESAVPFGRVIRDGGEAIELFVDRRQPLEAFLGDWTATHEFSHLMLPYVEPRHRWISEGFAQYYQNVLLARSGTYDPQTAWQKLYDGLERGRQSRPELSPNEATAGDTRNGRMKIYWSGAAIALMADVALRERSGGEMTLDDVMGQLQACCLPSDQTWSGPELFATLDTLTGAPVFMPLYRRYADTSGFPDTRPLFERLGIAVEDDKIRIRRSGELQHIRSAITQWDDATVARRGQPAGMAHRNAAGSAGSR